MFKKDYRQKLSKLKRSIIKDLSKAIKKYQYSPKKTVYVSEEDELDFFDNRPDIETIDDRGFATVKEKGYIRLELLLTDGTIKLEELISLLEELS